ncbi:unnamed protein product [Pleuronectes platessa]|uniref:Uncharacterized protein n=1 Tax=Pleuronectes platessa TaxID=8262 RepID=A0A9N7TX37_PLEPL|nr:unnamed protein product [Pleuronectes platessa]
MSVGFLFSELDQRLSVVDRVSAGTHQRPVHENEGREAASFRDRQTQSVSWRQELQLVQSTQRCLELNQQEETQTANAKKEDQSQDFTYFLVNCTKLDPLLHRELLRWDTWGQVGSAQWILLGNGRTHLKKACGTLECDNFITVIQKVNDTFIACGTNAGSPRCWMLVNDTVLTDVQGNGQMASASDISPPYPSQKSISLPAGDTYTTCMAVII